MRDSGAKKKAGDTEQVRTIVFVTSPHFVLVFLLTDLAEKAQEGTARSVIE